MQAEFDAQLAALQEKANAQKSDEEAQKEAAEAKVRIEAEMKFKIEQQRLDQEKEAADRAERIRLEEIAIKKKQQELTLLEGRLTKILPMVNEANLISAELKRDCKFETKIIREMSQFGPKDSDYHTELKVRVDNNNKVDGGYYVMWDFDKFENRLSLMRQDLNAYFDTEEMPSYPVKEKDPWWDPIEPLQLGVAYLGLQSFSYGLGVDMIPKGIMSSEGLTGQRGKLTVGGEVCAKDKSGKWVNWEEIDVPEGEEGLYDCIEEPTDMLGKALNLKVQIKDVTDLPEDLCTNVFATYCWKHSPNDIQSLEECKGQSNKHNFDYEKMHDFPAITDYHLSYFKESELGVKVWAYPFYKGCAPGAGKVIEKNLLNDPRASKAQKEKAVEQHAEQSMKRA